VGEFERIGGAMALARLMDAVPSTANFPHHMQVVRDSWQRRCLIQAANQVLELARTGCEAQEVRQALEEALHEQDRNGAVVTVQTIAQLMPEVRRQMRPAAERQEGGFVETGIAELDEILCGGLYEGSLYVVAGRPSMGKSALALKICRHIAERQPVALFSLEMSSAELVKNLVALESGVNSYKIRRGTYQDEYTLQCVEEASQSLVDLQLHIADAGELDLGKIASACRRLHYQKGLGLVCIDYLQLIQGREGRRREETVAKLSHGCKALARSLKVPVLLVSQLNRDVDSKTRKDHRPRLSDLRESGAIEQDADVVAFLYRQGYYDQKVKDQEGKAGTSKTELIVGKQRLGPIGTVLLRFLMRCGDFEPWREQDEEPKPSGDLRGAHIERTAGEDLEEDDLPF